MPIPLIAGAIAAPLVGAAFQSHAATKAAETEQKSAQAALDFSRQVYGDQKALLSPYVQMGTNALPGLAAYNAQPFSQRLANLGQPYSFSTAQGGPAYRPPMGGPVPPSMGNYGGGFGGMIGAVGNAAPQAAAMARPNGNGGGMVTVRDDSGETRQVPQAHAPFYQQRGFQVMAS